MELQYYTIADCPEQCRIVDIEESCSECIYYRGMDEVTSTITCVYGRED